MADMYDCVSNIHYDWIWTNEPLVRNCGINIRRKKEEDKILGYTIVVDHNPESDLLSFELLKTTIKYYVKECEYSRFSLTIRIPIDENFEHVDRALANPDYHFMFEDYPCKNGGKEFKVREYYKMF